MLISTLWQGDFNSQQNCEPSREQRWHGPIRDELAREMMVREPGPQPFSSSACILQYLKKRKKVWSPWGSLNLNILFADISLPNQVKSSVLGRSVMCSQFIYKPITLSVLEGVFLVDLLVALLILPSWVISIVLPALLPKKPTKKQPTQPSSKATQNSTIQPFLKRVRSPKRLLQAT